MDFNLKAGKLLSLEGKTAVVSGASSGIGRASARLFALMGARAALLDIDPRGEELVQELNGGQSRAKFYSCDVSSDPDCREAAECIKKDFGRIDILLNNAGLIHRKNVLELSEGEWDREISVNLKSVYILSRRILPFMIEQGGGCIVNVSSGWGLKGGPKAAAYCASKAAIVNLTRSMAIDFGPNNIRVNCICPGDTDTPLLRSEAEQLCQEEEAFMREAAERPLKRIGKPEDIAKAALFLASDMASWMTGSVLVVDGGGLA
jgi:NAD(P)-dependent dehydrogenase (short-subunit alcohol dehydrogenase family)